MQQHKKVARIVARKNAHCNRPHSLDINIKLFQLLFRLDNQPLFGRIEDWTRENGGKRAYYFFEILIL